MAMARCGPGQLWFEELRRSGGKATGLRVFADRDQGVGGGAAERADDDVVLAGVGGGQSSARCGPGEVTFAEFGKEQRGELVWWGSRRARVPYREFPLQAGLLSRTSPPRERLPAACCRRRAAGLVRIPSVIGAQHDAYPLVAVSSPARE